jgi:hypothetical protein
VARGDPTGRLGDPALVEPSLAHRGHDGCPDALHVAVVDVVPEAERVGREQRLHGALLHPTVALTAFISSASVTIVPVNPSSSQQQSVSWAWLRCRHVSTAGTTRWADMIARVPAAIAARNARLDRQQLVARGGDDGQSRCESTSVAPWPGKCFAQAATPPACRPVTSGDVAGDQRGVGAEERTPITG